MDEREMVSADEAREMEHRSDGCDEAADVMHMERSALRYVRTVIALHAIVEGRAAAPTDAELAAHAAAGGSWLVRYHRDGWGGDDAAAFLDVLDPREIRDGLRAVRWWALTIDGRPCAWPEVSRG